MIPPAFSDVVLRALKNCDFIGARLGVSAFANEQHERRAGCAFQPRGMGGRRSLTTSWLTLLAGFLLRLCSRGQRIPLCVV